jgi:ABC-type sugar transport system permease subunit
VTVPSSSSLRSVFLLAPLSLYLLAFLLYPAAYAIHLAFTDPLRGEFPSLANLRTLWNDSLFRTALAGNVLLPVLSVALELVLGLALALLLTARFPGRRWLRVVVIVPFALPEIVFLTTMRFIFAPRGYANAALLGLGLSPVEWLTPGSPLAYATVIVVDAWHVTPVVFLMLLAALSAMPEDVSDAAALDGAGALRRFRYITLPLLRPAIIAALLLRGLDAVRIFAAPLVLGGVEGVPVISTYAYHQWSDYGDSGAAAAAATLLALLCVVMAVPLLHRRVMP